MVSRRADTSSKQKRREPHSDSRSNLRCTTAYEEAAREMRAWVAAVTPYCSSATLLRALTAPLRLMMRTDRALSRLKATKQTMTRKGTCFFKTIQSSCCSAVSQRCACAGT